MQYTTLGSTGVTVSRIALGACFFGWRIDEELSRSILDRALDLGINVVDTAESYGDQHDHASERTLARLLRGRRDQVFLSTKVGPTRPWAGRVNTGLSRRVVVQVVEGSLRRLETDHIDLVYAHFPDDATPLEEAVAAFDDLVRAGKLRYAGLSNHSASKVVEALWIGQRLGHRPIVATQDLYNLFERVNEWDLYPTCLRHRIGSFAYAVMAGGLLSGKYTLEMAHDPSLIPSATRASYYGRYGDDSAPTRSSPKLTKRTIDAVGRVEVWAKQRGHTTSQVALAWVLGHPAVTSAMLGVSNLQQLEENRPAFDLELTAQDREELADLIPRDTVNRVAPTW